MAFWERLFFSCMGFQFLNFAFPAQSCMCWKLKTFGVVFMSFHTIFHSRVLFCAIYSVMQWANQVHRYQFGAKKVEKVGKKHFKHLSLVHIPPQRFCFVLLGLLKTRYSTLL